MNYKLMKQAWNIQLKPAEKLLLLSLCVYANDEGVCWPSQAALGEKTGMSERTIRDAAKSLTETKHITVEKHGKNRNRYQVVIRQISPDSDRQISPLLDSQNRQISPDSAADFAGLDRQISPEHNKNRSIEHTKEQSSCPANAELGAEKTAPKKPKKQSAEKPKEKPPLSPEIMVLGERLAVCRAKDAGLKRTTPEAIAYYADLVNVILKRGEVEMADIEQVVGWFETPEGMDSFKYGMSNMAKDYSHALIRNLPMYLRRARGESTPARGIPTQRYQRPEVQQGFDYDILGSGDYTLPSGGES